VLVPKVPTGVLVVPPLECIPGFILTRTRFGGRWAEADDSTRFGTVDSRAVVDLARSEPVRLRCPPAPKPRRGLRAGDFVGRRPPRVGVEPDLLTRVPRSQITISRTFGTNAARRIVAGL